MTTFFPRSSVVGPTLYEWAGGHDAIRRMLDVFYDHVEQDALLSPVFPGGVTEHHRSHVTDWWCEVFGGPPVYTDAHGGYPNMVAKHIDLAVTPEQRRRLVSLMSQAADEADLRADPEFRAALMSYLEWGNRLALTNSQSGADVVFEAPVPRGGWGVAPPYRP